MGISKPSDNEENLHDHIDLTSRIKRTLYYDPIKEPDKDTLSYSATESLVSHFREVAPMPIGKLGHRYASRVAREACISPCAMLLGLIYIERLKNKNPKYLENISSSELFLVSMMVSSKYLYDEGCDEEVFNDEWALSGDIDVKRVNDLEKEFLHAIDWHLYVHPHEFSSILNTAETNVALANGGKRGWLTYCDLTSVLNSQRVCDQLMHAAKILSKVTCYCAVIYSGLVCVTAVTSVALVAMSAKSRDKPFGPLTNSEASHLTVNFSETDSAVDLPSSEEMFSSSHSLRKLSRQRTVCNDEKCQSLKNRPEAIEENQRFPGLSSCTGEDEAKVTSRKDEACSISTLVEAILFMTNVPQLCLQRGKITRFTDRCEKCGKPNMKRNNQHYKYSSKFKAFCNHSMYLEPLTGHGSDPRLKFNAYYRGLRSKIGVYNPTLPPASTLPITPTHLSTVEMQ